ncbi:MAG TPA: hypothetical protein VGC88_03345, partial [Terriglobales bacterium]
MADVGATVIADAAEAAADASGFVYTIRDGLGFPELLWALRQRMRRARGRNWGATQGIVQGHELIRQRSDGWFVLFYSYTHEGHYFSGESRKYLFLRPLEKMDELASRWPVGSGITVRVDSGHP